MIYPTIKQRTNGEFNRYELVVGVAKCARIVTDEYVEMRAKAQKMIDNRETEKPLATLIDPEYKDQKAVKIAIAKLESGRFKMAHREDAEAMRAQIKAEREAAKAAMLASAETESVEEEAVANEE